MSDTTTRFLSLAAILLAVVGFQTACGDAGEDNNSAPITTKDGGTDTDTDAGMTDTGQRSDTGNQKQEPNPDNAELPNPDDFDYSAETTFQMGDLLGGFDGVRAADDPSLICETGCEDKVKTDGSVTLYPIDNGFGWDAVDFVGATPRERDGVHEEGWIGPINDADGNHIGIAVSTRPTLKFKAGPHLGQWCAGLGGEMVKCKSDHYVTMEHVLTCDETIPYMNYDPVTGEPVISDYDNCVPLDDNLDGDLSSLTPYAFDLENLVSTSDYSMINGETPGEYKYIWGNWDKRPTDVRLLSRIELPAEWKEQGRTFEVTSAKLAIVHTITNNPNDQIAPEDMSNEGAAGQLPGYEVEPDGRWVSTRDCYEGDGDFIPAGTTLRNPPFADENGHSADIVEGYTNAWYTTLDREPFMDGTNSGPRWRLKAPKFGQDLPGVEIPVEPCSLAPLKKEEVKYTRGDLTTTVIDLLDPLGPGEGTPLSTSTGFVAPNSAQNMVDETMTNEGVTLSEDFELSMHIKGDNVPVRLYKAVLYLDYEEITDEQ